MELDFLTKEALRHEFTRYLNYRGYALSSSIVVTEHSIYAELHGVINVHDFTQLVITTAPKGNKTTGVRLSSKDLRNKQIVGTFKFNTKCV